MYQPNHRQPIESLPYQMLVVSNEANEQECLICLEIIQSHSLIIFGECGHIFCRPCLSQHIIFSLKHYNMPKCPQQFCKQKLSRNSQAYQLLDNDQRQKFEKILSYLNIINNPNILPCQRESCIGFFDKNMQIFNCNLCKAKHCSGCFQLHHSGQCQMKIAIELQTKQKFRQCRQCGQIIQKIEGCTHMVCTCGHYFCFVCGQSLRERKHVCVVPAELNFLQAVRWSIQHEELWYQSNFVNFLHYLMLVSPSRERGVSFQVVWAVFYLLLIYPISLVVAIGLSFLGLAFICLMLIFFTLFLPFTPLLFYQDKFSLWPTTMIFEQFGTVVTYIIIVLLYPILFVVNLIQFIILITSEEDFTLENVCIIPNHLLKGIRNILFMPCLMLINNQKYYLALGKLRQESLMRQAYTNLIDI